MNCSKCGYDIDSTDKFCKNCGKVINSKRDTPVSVTVAIIMLAIGGVTELIYGLGLFLSLFVQEVLYGPTLIFVVFAIVICIIFGILNIIATYGLWKLKKWAGILGIVTNMVILFVGISIITLLSMRLSSWVILPFILTDIFLPILTIIFIVLLWKYLE